MTTRQIKAYVLFAAWTMACCAKDRNVYRCKDDNEMWKNLAFVGGSRQFRYMDDPFIEFPASKCRKNESQERIICGQLFSGLSARKFLFKNGREAALSKVLSTIVNACTNTCGLSPSELSFHDGARSATAVKCFDSCDGAMPAIYFFNQAREDEQIRHFFASNPKLFQRATTARYAFFANRPDPQKWKELVRVIAEKIPFCNATTAPECLPDDPMSPSRHSEDWTPQLDQIVDR